MEFFDRKGEQDMRCSCQRCGTYMVQEERGLESRCICPQCFATCSACMGTAQKPEQREGLELIAYLRQRYDMQLEEGDAEPPDSSTEDPYWD